MIYEFAKVFSGKFRRYQYMAPGFEIAKNFMASCLILKFDEGFLLALTNYCHSGLSFMKSI